MARYRPVHDHNVRAFLSKVLVRLCLDHLKKRDATGAIRRRVAARACARR